MAGKNGALCMCGCHQLTAGGRFLPGHDAKLKGELQRAYRGPSGTSIKQKQLIEELGWSHLMKSSNGNVGKTRVRSKPARKSKAKIEPAAATAPMAG